MFAPNFNKEKIYKNDLPKFEKKRNKILFSEGERDKGIKEYGIIQKNIEHLNKIVPRKKKCKL
jgi:hypothetical protein